MCTTEKHWRIALGVVGVLIAGALIAGAVVFFVVILPREDFCDAPAPLPSWLFVEDRESNLTILWQRSIFGCDGRYLLQYSINGEQQTEVTRAQEHIIPSPPVCSDILVALWTVSETGRISQHALTHNSTVLPLDTFVTNTAINRTGIGTVASWERPAKLQACNVIYAVSFNSEFGEFRENTTFRNITVPGDIFCFTLRVSVSLIVGFAETWPSHVGFVDAESITANLSIPSENPFVLIANWSHHNENKCALSYKVEYHFGLGNQTVVVSEPRAIFDVRYCVSAFLIIVPSAFDGAHVGWSSFISATQFPDNIMLPPVENVLLERNDASMAVSWDIHDSLKQCSNLYTVNARNVELDEEANCQGTSNCTIILSSFCPSTEFIINPATLQGESVHKMYSC